MTAYKIRVVETSILFPGEHSPRFKHRELVYVSHLEKDRLHASVVKQKVFTLLAFPKTLVV